MLGEKIYIFLAVQSNLSWNESKLNLTVCTSQSLCHFTSKRSSMEKKIMHVCICVYVCLWLIYWRALHWCWQKDKFALLVLLCPSRASVHSLAGEMNWDKMSEQEMSDRCQTTVVHITDRHTHTHTHRHIDPHTHMTKYMNYQCHTETFIIKWWTCGFKFAPWFWSCIFLFST